MHADRQIKSADGARVEQLRLGELGGGEQHRPHKCFKKKTKTNSVRWICFHHPPSLHHRIIIVTTTQQIRTAPGQTDRFSDLAKKTPNLSRRATHPPTHSPGRARVAGLRARPRPVPTTQVPTDANRGKKYGSNSSQWPAACQSEKHRDDEGRGGEGRGRGRKIRP